MANFDHPSGNQFIAMLSLESGRNALLGEWKDLPSVPAGAVLKAHRAVEESVRRVTSLRNDKSRTPAQIADAGKKIANATVAELQNARAALKRWSESETEDAKAQIAAALAPDNSASSAVVRSEIRAFVLSKKADATFPAELRGLVESDLRFAQALFEAPAALSGLTSERLATLRHLAATAHAPEASERVMVAQNVAALDAKFAKVEAEVPRNYYNAGHAMQMASRVDVDAPLVSPSAE